MSSLLQVSDPHFGTEQPPVVEALLRLAREQRPDLVVLSGDITQRARKSQFQAARRFIERLSAPHVLAIPGNHDLPLYNLFARLLKPYGNYREALGVDLEPTCDLPAVLVTSVNTTRARRHKDGEISREQIERVASRLRLARADQLRIVVVHHPVHVIKESDRENLLHGGDSAVRQWADAGADLVLGGHIHLPYVRPLEQRLPDLSRRMWAVQAGTALSSRVRGRIPNSVNFVRYPSPRPVECRVERWDYEAASESFVRVETHELAIDRG